VILDVAQSAARARAVTFSEVGRNTMTLDTVMVMIAVTMMFATLAVVLGWADKYSNDVK
jgi:hypothetical protein